MLRRSLIKALTVSIILLAAGCGLASGEKQHVLIIGDSISLGYTPHVQEMLKSQAVVVHSEGNAQDSNNGIRNLEKWLGGTKWDVISFNFGLWDLCYRRKGPVTQENRDKVNGSVAVPLDEYEQNLSLIAARLKATGATVIFQDVTVVPANEPGRYSADVDRYNQVAVRVMKRYDISVNNLNAVSAKLPPEMHESDTDVHYTEPGYAELAKSVAESIRSAL